MNALEVIISSCLEQIIWDKPLFKHKKAKAVSTVLAIID
jgi:hypothetical protein